MMPFIRVFLSMDIWQPTPHPLAARWWGDRRINEFPPVKFPPLPHLWHLRDGGYRCWPGTHFDIDCHPPLTANGGVFGVATV
jgi:hypothetical protein